MKKNLILSAYISLVIISLAGCKKGFLDEKPEAIIAPDNLYVNKEGFEAGLYGLYFLVRSERMGINGGYNDIANTAAVIGVDNAYSLYPAGGAAESVFNDFGTRLNAAAPYISNTWAWLYKTINSANTIIGRADKEGIDWTEEEKRQIVGEARLIRAWAYRHLTYLWGAVPLTLEESSGANIRTDWERNSIEEVRAAMEQDWLYAEANMKELPVKEGRASRMVASHYLAELYLAMGKNQQAKEKAQSVVSNANYKLVTQRYGVNRTKGGTPFTDMFLDGNSNRAEGNTEVLWTFQNEYLSVGGEVNIMRRWWVNRYNTIKVNNKTPIAFSKENGGRGIGRFGATKYAFGVYGPGDDRNSGYAFSHYWIMNNAASLPAGSKPVATCSSPGYSGGKIGDTVFLSVDCNEPAPSATTAQNWPNTKKWDWAPDDINDVQNASGYNDQVYLRLAETYLLLAEAQFKLNDAEGAAATINVLRSRAKASPVTAADITLDFILDERSRELFSEEHRRYTLLRTGTWFDRTKKYNIYTGQRIALRDTLLPIPQTVIDANLTRPMPQNGGY